MSPSTNDRPLVSFIVASYNYGRFIGTTLKSIFDQTLQDFEIIVIDDASTDASLEVIRSFSDPRIHLHINEKNLGVVPTYNKAVSLAKGEYITYLDADDWIDPRKIEEQLAFFRRNPDVDLVATYTKFVDEDGNRHPLADRHENFYNRPFDFNAVETWIPPHKPLSCSVLLARSVFDRIGLRDQTMTTASDYELWARAHARGCRFGLVEVPLLYSRIHKDNASQQHLLNTYLEVTYVLHTAVLPTIEARSELHLIPAIFNWGVRQMQSGLLTEDQGHRLLGLLMGPQKYTSCRDMKKAVLSDESPSLLTLGRRFYATYSEMAAKVTARDQEITARDRQIVTHD